MSQFSCLARIPRPGGIGPGTSFLGSRDLPRQFNGPLLALILPWLNLNHTRIGAALTIFGSLYGTFPTLERVSRKIYWWVAKFFTASVSIDSNDRLHREVLSWLGSQVLEPRGTRMLTAKSETLRYDEDQDDFDAETNDTQTEKRAPIEYLPIFETTWFVLGRSIYLVRRNGNVTPDSKNSLVIMCLGRSATPIKKFLKICRDHADKISETSTRVFTTKQGSYWDGITSRPHRALGTVHFDEDAKEDLVADIQNYLDPSNRRFYMARGIPYRRGYLLHGPPGTGKTSLSFALAGYFGLELYLVHVPSVRNDGELELLFSTLPSICIVLLEDIDAVGLKRQSAEEADDDNNDPGKRKTRLSRSRVTLSGLLNILDGVASQEGRIVLMTSNFADKLDDALIRPGRIDKQIFLGHISPRTAEVMFIGMFAPEHTNGEAQNANLELGDNELGELALAFSRQIPEDTFTPAQVQGYLLRYRNSAATAAADTAAWIEEEKANAQEAEVRADKLRKAKAEKLKQKTKKKKESEQEDMPKASNSVSGAITQTDHPEDEAVGLAE